MKVGFIAILGRPNVGKSTLLNALLSKKVSIVTPRAQTTRDQISGILTEKDYQMVFVDTPGIFRGNATLDKQMRRTAFDSSRDVNFILYLVDASCKEFETDAKIFASIKSEAPRMIVLNKIDLIRPEKGQEIKAFFQSSFPDVAFLEASIKENFGLKEIKEAVLPHLEEGEPFYPEEWYTDKDLAYQAKEVIREQCLRFLHKEIPHQSAVYVEKIAEKKDGLSIQAAIVVERDQQKAIVIGKGGAMIEQIRSASLRECQRMWHRPICELRIRVEVDPDWRNDKRKLAKLGYGEL